MCPDSRKSTGASSIVHDDTVLAIKGLIVIVCTKKLL
jgi:hypothetical protein